MRSGDRGYYVAKAARYIASENELKARAAKKAKKRKNEVRLLKNGMLAFNISPGLLDEIYIEAICEKKTLNEWINDALKKAVREEEKENRKETL